MKKEDIRDKQKMYKHDAMLHIDRIEDDLSYMVGNIDGYLDTIIEGIERLRIESNKI